MRTQVPEVARVARQLVVVQRQPNWVGVKQRGQLFPCLRPILRWLPFSSRIYRCVQFLFYEMMFFLFIYCAPTAAFLRKQVTKVRPAVV